MTTDPLRPPAKRVRSEISKAAGKIERLKIKLRKQNKAIEETKGQLCQAKRFLTALLEDVAPEAPTFTSERQAEGDAHNRIIKGTLGDADPRIGVIGDWR